MHSTFLETLTTSLVPLQSSSNMNSKRNVTTDPTVQLLCEKILSFVLLMDGNSDKIVELLLDTTNISVDGE